jgi:uncharacterized membrane protein
MTATPALFLAVAYWLHMLATVTWLGGLAALATWVLPAARKTLSAEAYAALLSRLQGRLQWLAWLCLAVLGATGMFQMSASPHYQGFLAIRDSWGVAMLTKHIAVLLMLVASAYNTWGVLPALRRLALLHAVNRPVDAATAGRLARRERTLLQINLVLSVLVLAFTAWARAA